MKVTLGTIEVTDEERVAIADALDGKQTKRKATRDEARDFVLRHGQSWRELLSRAEEYEDLLGSPVDDLLGTDIQDEDLL